MLQKIIQKSLQNAVKSRGLTDMYHYYIMAIMRCMIMVYNNIIDSDDCVYVNDDLIGLVKVTDLRHAEIILLSMIIGLSQDGNVCTASNAHFAKFLRVTPHTISNYLGKLSDCGVITRYQDKINKYGGTVRCIAPQYDVICKLLGLQKEDCEWYPTNITDLIGYD